MFSIFLPHETNFFDLFEQHAALIVKAAEAFLRQVSQGQISEEKIQPVKEIEHQADELTHQCIEALHRTFITPIERNDIYQLIGRMDDIVDDIDAASDFLTIYKIQHMTSEVQNLAHILFQASQQVEQVVKGVRNLKETERIRECCRVVHQLENQADSILRQAIGDLFEKEEDLRLLIKWKEIYEILESATDRCEDVANIVEGIVMEYGG
jgi:uncharacterized protein